MIFIKVQILVHFVIEYHIIIIILQIIILFILKMFIILFSLYLLCPSFCILLQLSINYFTKLFHKYCKVQTNYTIVNMMNDDRHAHAENKCTMN